jgi:hypothetical protein
MKLDLKKLYGPGVRWLEKAIALAVLAGVLVAAVKGAIALSGMDWSSTETFYELIYRALLLVIGLELVRMLVAHSLAAVLELLAFVIARKMLKPDLTALDIILGVVAFVALLGGRKHLMSNTCYLPGELGDDHKPGEQGEGEASCRIK